MADIFPFLQPDLYAGQAAGAAEAYRDVKWDYAGDKPVFSSTGEPVIVEGLPAVMSWAWRALHTERFLSEIYSADYGNEILNLAGQQWIREVKEAEALRYVRECLQQHPNVRDIANGAASFADGLLTLRCSVICDYGSAQLEVTYHV